LFEAITYGAVQRVRPKLMTVCMITFGLVPALWAHGAGAEAIQRIAAPMVGGLITSTILTLEIVPAIYSLWRGRQVEWVKGPRPPRKNWSELSHEFVEMERAGHHDAVAAPASPLGSREGDVIAAAERSATVTHRPRKWAWILVGIAVVVGGAIWFAGESGPKLVSNPPPEAHPGKPTASLPKLGLTDHQARAAKSFIAAAAAVGECLAEDNLAAFNRAAANTAPELERLVQSLPPGHPWLPLLQMLPSNGHLAAAGDLAEARKEFLPFSTAVSEFARAARQQSDTFKSLKLYRCPMAPKPGFWLQFEGPLRNPYFGSEMLDCGSEITP